MITIGSSGKRSQTCSAPIRLSLANKRASDAWRHLGTALALATAVSLLPTSLAIAQQSVTLRLAHFVPLVHPMHREVLQPWTERISAASNGRLRISVHPAGELGRDPTGQLERVRRGEVDLIWGLPGYNPERFARTLLASQPGLFKNAEEATEAIARVQAQAFAAEFGDVKLIALWANEPAALFTRRAAVRDIAELKGRTIRHPTVAGAELVSAWGALPAKSRIEVSAQSLREGSIDAAFMDIGAAVAFGVEREATHLLHELPSMTALFFVLMNRARWEALPPDLQALLERHNGRALACAGAKAYRDQGVTALAAVRASGVQVGTLAAAQQAAFEEAAAVVRREAVTRLRGQGIDGDAILAALGAARQGDRACRE